jgi:hypothetical protein
VHHLKVREEIGPVWFDPVKANLTGLKLHADVDWGWVPEADFRGLHFPRLRKLELGNYTFSHDWQLEWILSHGKTLEELALDDCPIIYHARNFGGLKKEGYVIDPKIDVGEEITRTYDHRWSHFFEEMERRLPALKRFQYGIGPCGSKAT